MRSPRVAGTQPFFAFIGAAVNSSSWPKPVGEVFETMVVQVPAGTCVQALPA